VYNNPVEEFEALLKIDYRELERGRRTWPIPVHNLWFFPLSSQYLVLSFDHLYKFDCDLNRSLTCDDFTLIMKDVKQVSVSYGHVLVLTVKNVVFGFGNNTAGKICGWNKDFRRLSAHFSKMKIMQYPA
jgi:hypothetical protein